VPALEFIRTVDFCVSILSHVQNSLFMKADASSHVVEIRSINAPRGRHNYEAQANANSQTYWRVGSADTVVLVSYYMDQMIVDVAEVVGVMRSIGVAR
jgi:hypothetical protein